MFSRSESLGSGLEINSQSADSGTQVSKGIAYPDRLPHFRGVLIPHLVRITTVT